MLQYEKNVDFLTNSKLINDIEVVFEASKKWPTNKKQISGLYEHSLCLFPSGIINGSDVVRLLKSFEKLIQIYTDFVNNDLYNYCKAVSDCINGLDSKGYTVNNLMPLMNIVHRLDLNIKKEITIFDKIKFLDSGLASIINKVKNLQKQTNEMIEGEYYDSLLEELFWDGSIILQNNDNITNLEKKYSIIYSKTDISDIYRIFQKINKNKYMTNIDLVKKIDSQTKLLISNSTEKLDTISSIDNTYSYHIEHLIEFLQKYPKLFTDNYYRFFNNLIYVIKEIKETIEKTDSWLKSKNI